MPPIRLPAARAAALTEQAVRRISFAVALLFSVLAAAPAAGQAATGEIRGRVVEAVRERPVADAEVRLTQLGRVARTDSLGRFSITGLPPGRHPLEVRRLGYTPMQADVSVAAEALEIEVQLSVEPQPLAGVTAEARPVSERMRAFEDRRANGSAGRFLGREELEKHERRQLADVLRRFPGVRIAGGGGRVYLASSRTQQPRALITVPRPCYAQIYINGVQIYGDDGGSDPPNLHEFDISHLEGLEYYNGPSSTPPEFRTLFSSCGTLVLWLRDAR